MLAQHHYNNLAFTIYLGHLVKNLENKKDHQPLSIRFDGLFESRYNQATLKTGAGGGT